jgi:GTP diphosphokinase / guanosine-3',5'-bis(diphosphate) 3'-diphosphatase
LVNKTSRPSLDWLTIVHTSSAKHKIKQWFRKERKHENVVLGQEAVERELAREHLRPDLARGELIERIAKRMNHAEPTDLFAAIGFGDTSATTVVQRIKDEMKSSNIVELSTLQRVAPPASAARRPSRNASGIRIAGVDDVLVRVSKCCSPVPGDPIMGYVTIGKGVSVHRADCPNVAYMAASPERILQASWIETAEHTHAVDVEVEAIDRAGLLQDVMAACAEYKTNASSVTARVKRDKTAVISLTLEIANLVHLHKVLEKLRAIKDVRTVYRVTKREAKSG